MNEVLSREKIEPILFKNRFQLNNETQAMKDFILDLIKKGKLESEELLSNTNLKNRQTAFLEAMAACPPGNDFF